MFPLYHMKVWVIRQIAKESKCWKEGVFMQKKADQTRLRMQKRFGFTDCQREKNQKG